MLDIYVYECVECGEKEAFPAESVAEPEVHLDETEQVYCSSCEVDRAMYLRGLEGWFDDEDYVDFGDTGERYCPLCESNCQQ